jgi:type 1 glutamine amidotransferase
MRRLALPFALLALVACAGGPALAADTKIVLIAGHPSHGPEEHEFNAGTLLLEKWLKGIPGIAPVVVKNDWPKDEGVFEGARAVVFYMDGGDNHPMINRPERVALMKKLMGQGVGLVCVHYAVEFPVKVKDPVLEWLGGYYETGYSTNPTNNLEVSPAADHPIARGVKPFTARDEWYYRIRFKPDDKRVKPILTAKVPDPRSPEPQTLAWATERENGGRSFGFTGAHFHKNWGVPEFRRLVLNAILWSAKLDVPPGGAPSELSQEDLAKNLDEKGPRKKR